MSRPIAVTGATGYVGRFVVPHLLARGQRVRALLRPGSQPLPASGAIDYVAGDLLGSFDALVDGAAAVVHLAYQHEPGRYRGGEGDDLAGWLRANLDGSLRLLLAARDANVPQFVFLSSRAVFSRTEPGRVLDEYHPTSPATHYGAYKVAVEALLRSFAEVEGMVTTSVRATGVYGVVQPIERSKWYGLVQQALRGRPIAQARSGTEVHGDDVARTIARLLEQPLNPPPIVHLSDLVVSTRRIVALVHEISGSSGPLPPPSPPTVANPLASKLLPSLGIELGGEPLLRQTIAQLLNQT